MLATLFLRVAAVAGSVLLVATIVFLLLVLFRGWKSDPRAIRQLAPAGAVVAYVALAACATSALDVLLRERSPSLRIAAVALASLLLPWCSYPALASADPSRSLELLAAAGLLGAAVLAPVEAARALLPDRVLVCFSVGLTCGGLVGAVAGRWTPDAGVPWGLLGGGAVVAALLVGDRVRRRPSDAAEGPRRVAWTAPTLALGVSLVGLSLGTCLLLKPSRPSHNREVVQALRSIAAQQVLYRTQSESDGRYATLDELVGARLIEPDFLRVKHGYKLECAPCRADPARAFFAVANPVPPTTGPGYCTADAKRFRVYEAPAPIPLDVENCAIPAGAEIVPGQ